MYTDKRKCWDMWRRRGQTRWTLTWVEGWYTAVVLMARVLLPWLSSVRAKPPKYWNHNMSTKRNEWRSCESTYTPQLDWFSNLLKSVRSFTTPAKNKKYNILFLLQCLKGLEVKSNSMLDLWPVTKILLRVRVLIIRSSSRPVHFWAQGHKGQIRLTPKETSQLKFSIRVQFFCHFHECLPSCCRCSPQTHCAWTTPSWRSWPRTSARPDSFQKAPDGSGQQEGWRAGSRLVHTHRLFLMRRLFSEHENNHGFIHSFIHWYLNVS